MKSNKLLVVVKDFILDGINFSKDEFLEITVLQGSSFVMYKGKMLDPILITMNKECIEEYKGVKKCCQYSDISKCKSYCFFNGKY
jgi:hypothetical protein